MFIKNHYLMITILLTINSPKSALAVGPDHSPPDLIDHVPPAKNNCYHVDYIFELKTGRKWSRLPAFTRVLRPSFEVVREGQALKKIFFVYFVCFEYFEYLCNNKRYQIWN
jgi:hypothetical protein